MSFQDFFKNSVWEDFLSRQAVTSSTLTSMIVSLLVALALGLFIYVIYRRFFGGVVFSRSFATTLVGMCVLTCMVTLAISTNVVIGKYAFANCSSLRHYAVSPNLYVIDEGAFMHSGLEAFDASAAASFTVVGPWAFAYCASLSEVHLSNAIVKMGEGAFFDCAQLSAAILPPSVRQVPNYLFKGAAAVTADNLNIAGATAIGDYAMARMEGLGSVTLPGSLTSVGEGAFLGLKASIVYAQALAAVPVTAADAFAEINQPAVTLYVADDLYEDFAAADQWREFNIVKYSSGVDDALGTITLEGTPALKARFVGTDLQVSIDGINIAWIALYNEAGLLLTAVEPDADVVTIPTEAMQARVFIVSARLADGTDASLKIARR